MTAQLLSARVFTVADERFNMSTSRKVSKTTGRQNVCGHENSTRQRQAEVWLANVPTRRFGATTQPGEPLMRNGVKQSTSCQSDILTSSRDDSNSIIINHRTDLLYLETR